MKRTKLFLTAALLIAAIGGAVASTNVTSQFFYYHNNDETTTPLPIQSSVDCPLLRVRTCKITIPGEVGVRQLFILQAGSYIPVGKQ